MERGKGDKYFGIQISDVIQLCCLNMLTGICSINDNGFSGQVFIKGGEVVHAFADGIQGEQAFYRIMRHSYGDIEFKEGPLAVEQTIKSPWEHFRCVWGARDCGLESCRSYTAYHTRWQKVEKRVRAPK